MSFRLRLSSYPSPINQQTPIEASFPKIKINKMDFAILGCLRSHLEKSSNVTMNIPYIMQLLKSDHNGKELS
jgi:hypothetical protein